MSIDIKLKNDTDADFWEVLVAGELDVSTADEFKEYLHKLIDKGIKNIRLNLENLDYIDSTGLGVIIGILKRIKVENKIVNREKSWQNQNTNVSSLSFQVKL